MDEIALRKIVTANFGTDDAKALAALTEIVRTTGAAPGLALAELEDIWAPLPPVPWLVQELDMAPGAPTLLAAYGFTGKTLASQAMAISVAAGLPVWGRFQARQGRVVHLDFEQGSRLTYDRYQRLARGMGVSAKQLEGRLAVAALPSMPLTHPAAEAEVTRVCKTAALCLVDSYRAACPTIEENSSEARIPLDMLNRVSESTGCVFLVIHHCRKPGDKDGKGGARMAIRGSGALYDAPASVLVFSADKSGPIKVEHEKARVSGMLRGDFALRIDDVGTDGVRLVAEDIATPAEQKAARQDALQATIVGFVAGNPGCVLTEIRAAGKGHGKDDVDAVIAKLVRVGRLVEAPGSRGARTFKIGGLQ